MVKQTGHSDFGQFGPIQFYFSPIRLTIWCVMVGPKGWDLEGKGPKIKKVCLRRVGGPKISRFFSPFSRRQFRSFSLSLGVFSWNFGGVFECRDPQMCTFGFSGCRVKPPGALLSRPHPEGPRRDTLDPKMDWPKSVSSKGKRGRTLQEKGKPVRREGTNPAGLQRWVFGVFGCLGFMGLRILVWVLEVGCRV